MVISTLIGACRKSLESIQIQLSLEGRVLGLMEEFRHDVLDEFFGFVYEEASTMRLPRNDVCLSIFFDDIKHFVKHTREGHSRDVGFLEGCINR